MKRSFFTRFISMILLAAVLLQTVPVAYAGVIRDENTGMISLTDANGKVVESHTEEEWAALFPTGTFAFRETELSLIEGAGEGEGKTATLTLYRLGGTTGKAEATVTLTPAVAKIEEDRFSYANAMGTKDYTVTVEDPWPIAQYQAFGGMGEIIYTGAPLTYLAADEEDYAAAEGEEITPVTLLAPEGADSYRWQMEARFFETEYYMKRWGDIENATSREFHFSEEMLDMYLDSTTYTYDFRCIYEIDGVLYCSDTLRGVQYKTGEDLPPVKPKDFVDVRERTDSKIQFDGEEYDSYSFPVTFADGEWEKEITFTVLDDDLHETVELLSVVLSDSRGAPVNKSACTVTVSIQDDEEVLPSQMGFAQSEIWVDKSAGTARIPLTRISEGLQYVTGVGYQVEDGTAIIGEDYATADTSTLFASDMDYTYIEVDLINNGLPLTKEESELYFTVKLTEPMGGTLLAGQTEIKVRLYNTAAEGNANLATELYSAEETDLTGKVTETTALVPANSTVTATAADTGANAVATYSLYPEDGISAFTHNYGVMTFENANGGNYWTDNAMLAFDRDSVLKYNLPSAGLTDDHEKYMSNRIANWEGESGNYGSTGVYLRREKGGSMTMQVPHLYDRYTEVGVVAMGRAEKSAKGWYGADDFSIVSFGIRGDSYDWKWLANPPDGKWQTHNLLFIPDRNSGNYLEFVHQYSGIWPEGDAQSESRLVSGYMKRRQMSMPQLRIHTADDDFIQKEEATKALHEAIKPVVALVAGQGGTTKDGTKLYNNSTLTVTRGVSASSYDFADQDNGANKNQSLFYSGEDENRRFELSTSTVNKDGGRITLLRDAESIQSGEDTYINVVMQRTQKYALEISPSVPKSDGTNIDAAKIGETWDNFWDKVYANNPDGITYTYREVDWDFTENGDGFTDPKSVTLNKQNGSTTAWTNSDSTKYTYSTALKNVMSINFHLDPEDRIVLAGTAYAGDEDIPLPANVLLDDTVTFYYYDKEYVTGINTMLASISRVQRFIDLEPTNSPTYGTILGTVDPVTGQFVPDKSEILYNEAPGADNTNATYYELSSLTDESYSITQLSPHGPNGDKHQIVLKVFYTMLPRSLVLPEGANIDEDKAEVVPALVTSVTEPSVRAKMTEEQLAYRYINHFGTGDDKLMYTAAASAPSYVDIPLGGDYGYKFAGADEKGYSKVEWTPDWRGNPYKKTGDLNAISFEDPDPIYIDGTLLGDRYPVGEVFNAEGKLAGSTETGTPGKLTDQGIATVNNYLFSIQASDTFSLCVREDVDDGTSTYAGATNEIDGIESSTLSVTSTSASHKSFGEIEDPSIGETADGKNKKNAVMDSSKANSSFPEYDMLGDITLPAMDLGISDFVSVGIDGQEMSLSIGMGIVSGGWESNFKDQTNHKLQSFEGQDPVDTNREAVGKIKRFINTVKGDNTLPGTKKTMGESYREYNKEVYDARRSRPLKPGSTTERQGTVASKGIGLSLGVEIGIVLKWDPIENRFFFNQAYLMAAVSAEFAYTVRFTPVPFLFLCVKFSIGIEFAVALEASRVKVIGTDTDFKDQKPTTSHPPVNAKESNNENTFYSTKGTWTYYKNQEHMGHDKLEKPEGNDFFVGNPGSSFEYTTTEKALDIYFCGTLYVEIVAYGDNGTLLEDFEPGVIQSAGDEAVTVKATRSVDGNALKPYTYRFTVVANDGVRKIDTPAGYIDLVEGATIVDRIVSIQRQTHDVYFGGFSISPELFFEVSVGFDALLFTFELFLNISVGCSFAIGVHDSADYAGQKADDYDFKFNEFSAAFTLGFRVSALLVINYEFTGIQFMITYDRETKYDEDTNKKTGWNFIWYGANQPFHQYSLLPEETNPLEPTIVLDSMTDRQEVIYTPEDNAAGEGTFAFPSSDTRVPFQYSGYGTSGEAFYLNNGIVPGSTYELVTAGGKNYLVYMISDDDADVDINKPRLAISLIQETVQDGVDTMGLVNPADPTGKGNPYLILDTDTYGDTDFDAWVDDAGDIHVAWVTYTEGSESAFINTIVDEDGNITAATSAETMRLLGPFTEVRTVKLDVTNTTDEEDDVASSTTTVTKGTVETVSPAFDAANPHGMYYMPQGAGDMVFYAEAEYYTPEQVEQILTDYETKYYTSPYVGKDTTEITKSGDTFYGTDDPTVLYQLAMKRTRLEAYGKSFYPNFAVRTGDNAYAITRVQSEEWMNDGVVLDNAALTKIGKVYYAAYSTSDIDLVDTDTSAEAENWDEQTIKKLYLQKLEVSTTSTADATTGATTTTTTVTPSKATALRKLVGYANSEDEDGVYTNNALADKYNDPYFANIQFLTGKLGNLDTTEEYNNEFSFDDQLQMTTFADTPETFLLFDMNGNTYVVPQNSLETLTVNLQEGGTASGKIIPFFTQAYAYAATEKDDITYEATAYRQDEPVATNVTIGTDGSGNIVAVYTRSENGVPGNAVYMTKYDPNYNSYSDNTASPWGAGTRLAMLNMDVVEEGETYNWSANKTSEHYFDTDGNGILDANDQPQSFQFNRLRIGLAGKDKLLVVTEGSLSQLTAVQRMQPTLKTDTTTGITEVIGIEPVTEEYVDASGDTATRPVYDFNLAKKDGTYDITKGLYALSFGMGQQSLSSAAIHLNDYDMTPGSEMGVSVSFVNNGDVAIRGSERQPIEINLMLEDVDAEGNISHIPMGITWQVTENIRAGQRVSTTLENIILPENINDGDRIYFTVTEDGEYVGSTGGTVFSATTLIDRLDAEGEPNPDTPACITVAAKPELYFDECSIEMVGTETINGEEHVILAPTIKVSNNGNANSDITYLHFQVEKAQENADGLTYVELYDLPLTGHKLTVSDEEAFTTFGGNGYTEANGYLQLRTMQDGKEVEDATEAGQIQPQHSRTVTGTFSVPKDYYDTHFGTGSLNLRVSIVSLNINKEVNDEYDMANNERSISVEPDTLYTTVNSIQMQKGSTMRLPLSMVTSTTTKPTITVTELTDNGSQNLSVLYYDANQGSLVVMAATGGTDDKPVEGKIRIADTSTNAIHDICYQIRGEGTAINIYNDNGIFTWYDSHNQGGQSGMNAWKFENALFWVQNDPATVPLNTDLAVATAGEYFTFQTFANKLDLYFFGADTNTPVTIEVTSNLGAFGTKTYTSQDYKTPVTIDFGGDSSVAHTVTVKAVSSEVRFDRMCEYFGDALNVSTDPTAPSIYWSRNPLPAPASIQKTADTKEPLTVTFADLGKLASVSLNGEDITNAVTKDGDGLWMYDMDITENGSYRFVVTDTGGNVTTRDLNVDWFTNTEPAQQDSGAPDITATLVDENGEPAPDFIPAGMDVYLAVTDEEGKLTEAELGRFVEVTQDEQKSQSFETIQSTLDPDHGYPVSTGGIYRVAVKDNGITSYRFVNLDGFDPNIPEVEIGFDKDSMVLTVTVSKQATLSGASPITSVMLNDAEELLAKGETTTYKQFQIPVVYGGTYKVTVRDQAGNVKTSDSIVITPPAIQIPADAITITKVEETEVVDKYGNVTYTSDKNGAVVIDETKITGGSYDPATSGTAGQLKPKYEYALVPAGTVPTNGDWQASPGFSKLDAGTYALYIRDVNHPDQVTGPILITVAFLRVVLQDVLVTQATKESGKDGSITVVATGGDGPLEYAIYEKHLIEDGTLILYNNGTTDTDNDDQLVYKQPDGTEVIRPLWQASPTRGDLTPGTYTVIVRDTTDPARFVEAEVTVPMEEDYAYLTDFFGDMWQIINQEYEITATAGEGGSISHEGVRKVKYSLTVQYSITPADGYRVVSVLVDGEDVGPVATYTFRSVKEDHTIEAIFEKEKDE